MKVLIDIKIKYFVLLVVFLVGCATTPTKVQVVSESTVKPEKYKSVWCNSVEVSGKHEGYDITSPVGINDGTFTRGNGKEAVLYTYFYDLEPRKKVTFRWEVYKPNGEILTSAGDAFITVSSSQTIHFNFMLDDKLNRESGVWTVKCFINGHYIFTEQFTILEH